MKALSIFNFYTLMENSNEEEKKVVEGEEGAEASTETATENSEAEAGAEEATVEGEEKKDEEAAE